MPTLVVSRGDTEERRLTLGQQPVRIGRAPGNDLILDNDGKSVSRFHAELRYENGQYVLVDLNSQNGVWIDGRRVERETLKSGLTAVIGPYRLTVEVPVPAVSAEGNSPAGEFAAASGATETIIVPVGPAVATDARKPAKRGPVKPAGSPASPGQWFRKGPVLAGVASIFLLTLTVGMIFARAHRGASAGVVPPVQTPPATPPPVSPPVPGPEPKPKIDESAAPVIPPVTVTLPPIEPAVPPPDKPAPVAGAAPGGAVTSVSPVDPPPPLLVTRRKGESLNAARARQRRLQDTYLAATTALGRGDFAGAERQFGEIVQDEPQFRDAAALFEKAREGGRLGREAAATQAATQAMTEGKRLEASEDLLGALAAYERARGLSAGLDGLPAAMANLRDKMRSAGETMYTQARTYDAQQRVSDALALYQRVVQLLPADSQHRTDAQNRISVLKGSIK